MKVLFVVSECQPFISTGGLAEVAGSLPKALSAETDSRVIMPLYSDIPEAWRAQFKFLCHFNVILGWRQQYCGLFEYEKDGVTYYFVDNEYYFKRKGLYGHYDDGERYAFYSKAVLEALPRLGFYPDVLHCNDWQTALVPIYLKTQYAQGEQYANMRTVFTIHNIEYQGKYSMDILEEVFGISNYFASIVEYQGIINLVKGAIQCCDMISTVSPTYAKEILSPGYSHGLHYILERNQDKLCGILNGIDTVSYNPETDPALFANYSKENLAGKAENKAALQRMLGLPEKPDVPVFAVISRLVSHKGVDLIMNALDEFLHLPVQFVVLGKGDTLYENYFTDMQKAYSEKMRACIAFNLDTSRKIYAGADVFLMPSRSEPCGLSQMIASRYGAIPITRETGGLYDSIRDFGYGESGNGFTFANYDSRDMLNRMYAAFECFKDKEEWARRVVRVMSEDFTWARSAEQYLSMYRKLV
ncbi:MAG: glycogen synthase GlgA [Clostridia bacterium]|nr:glycogen synthase GlgA [Clostridia bacterium]